MEACGCAEPHLDEIELLFVENELQQLNVADNCDA